MTDSPRPVVAAFDLDGTLTEGGSVFRWLKAVAGRRAAYRAAWRLALPLVVGAVRSGRSADRAKERLFAQLLSGREESEVAALSHEFAVGHLAARERPHVVARLRWHLDQGHHVVIVSASPELYARSIAQALGPEGAVATRLGVDALGRLSGGYLGRNCRGSEKLRRLEEWLTLRGLAGAEIYAYGNSRGDRRLLRGADHPYDCGKLGPVGALRHFPRLTNPG